MRIHILPLSLWLLVTAEIEAREAQVQQQQQMLPTAIKKMSPDQGEKFFPHYYAFPQIQAEANSFAQLSTPANPIAARRRSEDEEDARRLFANASTEIPYRQPFAPHLGYTTDQERIIGSEIDGMGLFRRAAQALAWLERRDWACPTGTSSCAAIGYPNSCCQEGETCVEITDTGLGNVGCCPEGATCAGSVSSCAAGNTPCASDIGGGCCIPGFVCEGVGCVRSSSATPTPTSQPTTPPPAGVTTVTRTSTSTGSGAQPTTAVVTVIVTITPSQSPLPTTRTTTRTTTASTTPLTTTTTSTTTDENPGAPVRPTSSLNDGNPASSSNTGANTFCPTGFYACVASAGGGCCQTGRDCQTTSCPPVAMTTLVNSNGITVVVPATAVPAATTGTCAQGWFLCGREAGPVAGCCPSGYECGTASCSVGGAGASATGTVAKELPGQGNGNGAGGRGRGGMGMVWGVGGLMLGMMLM